jgi:hypothetical protein
MEKNNIQVIKKVIEKETEEKLKTIQKGDVNQLINLMKEGEKKFIEKTGRNMTYSEMREMYG